jgi:CheY-like chemotaxis protein
LRAKPERVQRFTSQLSLAKESPRYRLKRELAGLPILVVENNATNRRILEDSVTHWKMMATIVEGASAAIQVLQQALSSGAPLPLLLTDAHMPDVDGFGLVSRIREEEWLCQWLL